MAAPGEAPPLQVTEPWQLIHQGSGDLGRRLGFVWRLVGGGPTIFLGSDSPDVPAWALRGIQAALEQSQIIVLGPVEDGGFWTMAGSQYDGRLLEGIDWGTTKVYDQTRRAAQNAGLTIGEAPRWYDVDTPEDLEALRRRLAAASDDALGRLRDRLDEICGGTAP